MSRFLLLLLLTASLSGQSTHHTSKVTVPDDLRVSLSLDEARELLDAGETARALEAWQHVLDDLAKKVVQVGRGRRQGNETDAVVDGDRYEGARRHVLSELVTTRDGELVAAYVTAFGERATEALREARALGDASALLEVATRYPLTPAGRAAGLAFVDHHLELGHFPEARRFARRLDDAFALTKAPARDRALAQARELVAAAAMGEANDLPEVRGPATEVPVRIGETTQPLEAWPSALGLAAETAPPVSPPAPSIEALGGRLRTFGFARNLNETDGFSVFYHDLDRIDADEHYPIHPVVEEGILYYADGLALHARSLYTGEPVWPTVRSPLPQFEGRLNRNLHHHVVVGRDHVYASLEDAPVMRQQVAWQGFQPVESIPTRKLLAVDKATGEVVWNHARPLIEDREDREFLRHFTINQPPVIVGDHLYATGTSLTGVFHHWIVALDRHTGAIIWRTYVGAGQQELNMFGNPIRECVPTPPVEHEGVLYWSTNVGTIAAVDAMTGEILWLSAYEQEPIPTTESTSTRERAPGWVPAPPAIHGDHLFVAPTDSYDLYKVALSDGRLTPVVMARRLRGNLHRAFLGVHEGLVVIAGRNIKCIDPETLSERHHTIDQSGGRRIEGAILGVPEVQGPYVAFTVRATDRSRSTIVNVADLRNGRIIAYAPAQGYEREGNVVLAPEAVVIATRERIDAYVDLDRVARDLERAASSGRADAGTLLRLGDILLNSGKHGQAFKTLARALDKAHEEGRSARATARRAQMALHTGWLRAAEHPEDHSGADLPSKIAERFARALEHAASDRQRVRTRLSCLLWAMTADESRVFDEHFEALTGPLAHEWVDGDDRLLSLYPRILVGTRLPAGAAAQLAAAGRAMIKGRPAVAVTHLHELQTEYHDLPVASGTAWEFSGTLIRELIAKHGTGIYAPLEREAKRRLAEAEKDGDLHGIRGVLQRYPQSSVVDRAYLALAKNLLAEDKHAEAVLEMQRYFARFGRTNPQAILTYAQSLGKLGAHRDAYEVLRRLQLADETARVKVDQREMSVAEATSTLLAAPELARFATPPALPKVERPLELRWKGPPASDASMLLLVKIAGRAPEGRQLLLTHSDQELTALNPVDGSPYFSLSAVRVPQFVEWSGEDLIVNLDGDLVRLDGETGDVQWRRPLDRGRVNDLALAHGKVWAAVRTILGRPSITVLTFDAISGEPIDEVQLPEAHNGRFEKGVAHLLFHALGENKAYIFDPLQGEVTAIHEVQRGGSVFFGPEDELIIPVGQGVRTGLRGQIVATNLVTGKEDWSWQQPAGGVGSISLHGTDGRRLAFSSRARGRNLRERSNERLVVLDLANGQVLLDQEVGSNCLCEHALFVGDHLYVTMNVVDPQAAQAARRVQAYDLRRSESPWTTVDYPGPPVSVSVTEKDLLVFRQPVGRTGNAPQLLFMSREDGRAVDLIAMEESNSPNIRSWGLGDLQLFGDLLVLCDGRRVSGFGPRGASGR